MNCRLFLESTYSDNILTLQKSLTQQLNLASLTSLRVIIIYDIIDPSNVLSQEKITDVFINSRTLKAIDEKNIQTSLKPNQFLAIEPIPGQFDQRADMAMKLLKLDEKNSDCIVFSATLYIFNENITTEDYTALKEYIFNPIDSRLKNLDLAPKDFFSHDKNLDQPPVYNGFIGYLEDELKQFKQDKSLALELDDLLWIQKYFKEEGRDPTETEIYMLDIYWSDHCRHSTFETALESIDLSGSQFTPQLESAYRRYIELRETLKRQDKPQTLMDLGTIFGRYQRSTGALDDMEKSDEVNACSVHIDVEIDGRSEPWLLMFKNETHNHPTEIEPFGGANTCVGGAIRDPLSGRAYVYQSMRITGSGNPFTPVSETLAGKLPQSKICTMAMEGNSAYANQIGATTSYVKEFYHDGFVAKRMELGALVGAVPTAHVTRLAPKTGDVILMLGARTGRDGVGAATGSSQIQNEKTLESAGSEVQKGSPSEERKIIRLFRNPKASKLIKKSNDFGAGGVCVAIGELADGLEINLDAVPTKYEGLTATELAIAESQERMAVMVAPEDVETFITLAEAEQIEIVVVAKVTESPRLVIHWQGKKIADISREFLDTNGVRKKSSVKVADTKEPSPFNIEPEGKTIEEKCVNHLTNLNSHSQKGLQQRFDSTSGGTTVLVPYGGKYRLSQAECSVQKIPHETGYTEDVSLLAHGYSPNYGVWSPYHGASYAVIESIARLIATGATPDKIRLSFQEYFERLDYDPVRFGKPFSALLGALMTQEAFNAPSIGGKDSMSGSFKDIDVPPTLVSFAVTTAKAKDIISPEFKSSGDYLYWMPMLIEGNEIPFEKIKTNFAKFSELHQKYHFTSASSIKSGGVAEAMANMSFGNRLGVRFKYADVVPHLFKPQFGGFLFTTKVPLEESDDYQMIGVTSSEYIFETHDKTILGKTIERAVHGNANTFYSVVSNENKKVELISSQNLPNITAQTKKAEPVVLIPVFEGTNGEYDMAKAFHRAGAKVNIAVYTTPEALTKEIESTDIFVLANGFITMDEPVIGRYMQLVLESKPVKSAIKALIARGGLILGVNAGYHALLNTGLLPYGHYEHQKKIWLEKNHQGHFINEFFEVKLVNQHSPWLQSVEPKAYQALFSSSFGQLRGDADFIQSLIDNGQVATQYTEDNGLSSINNIEAITDPTGKIYGTMLHAERYENGLYLNITGNKAFNIIQSAVNFFKA